MAFYRLIKTATGFVVHPWPSAIYSRNSLTEDRRNTTRQFSNAIDCGADNCDSVEFHAVDHHIRAPSFHKIFINKYILSRHPPLVKPGNEINYIQFISFPVLMPTGS